MRHSYSIAFFTYCNPDSVLMHDKRIHIPNRIHISDRAIKVKLPVCSPSR